jgi:two-component system copper resistance phosphate regulon response regulator CusR
MVWIEAESRPDIRSGFFVFLPDRDKRTSFQTRNFISYCNLKIKSAFLYEPSPVYVAAMKILVVEDEPKLASFVKKGLEEQSCEVDIAFDGQVGRTMALNNVYDVIVLDVNLPKMNGFDIVQSLREERVRTPVLMLTAMGSMDDKLMGFEAGADDYLVKPFEFRELMARLRALTKRSSDTGLQSNVLKVADLELDLNEKVARRGDKRIELTAKEFGLLDFLMRNRGRVVSRIDIAEKVWDIHFDTGTNVIDVYVNFLRKKIDKDFPQKLIHTVIGMGYMLKEE